MPSITLRVLPRTPVGPAILENVQQVESTCYFLSVPSLQGRPYEEFFQSRLREFIGINVKGFWMEEDGTVFYTTYMGQHDVTHGLEQIKSWLQEVMVKS